MMMMRTSLLINALLLLGSAVQAQQPAAEIAARYPNENAVFTQKLEHLILEFKKGELVARSEASEEMLLLSKQAPGIHNKSTVHHGYFNELTSIKGETLIPDSRRSGYRSLTTHPQ